MVITDRMICTSIETTQQCVCIYGTAVLNCDIQSCIIELIKFARFDLFCVSIYENSFNTLTLLTTVG